ncbi:MAG: hypothetical protein K2H40_07280 [Lachnospiraceae bacterium]|nr:hypothetical protein [Lachnospiraceae bacterium]
MNGQKKQYTGIRQFEDQEGSGTLTVTLRPYEPGDEDGMTACVRDEYGSTYFKKGFYDAAYLRKEAGNKKYTFLTAQTKAGEVAGMLVLEELGEEEALCEVESLFIRKKYRGYSLAGPFLHYGVEIVLGRNYAAACCHPALFHPITQKLLYRQGFRATGLLLNVFDAACMVHSYSNGRNSKFSLGLQLLPMKKKNAGTIYIPSEHRAFVERVYQGLSMTFQMVQRSGSKTADMPQRGEISLQVDSLQSSLEICIRHAGADLLERMAEIHALYPLTGKWTANVLLNINESHAVRAYKKLTGLHYFFSGLRPMGNAGEYMVLHNPGEVQCFFEDYAVSPEFAEILKYIGKYYERRNAHEKKKARYSP